MALDLSALSTEEAVTAIFVGYYDRAPAPNGLDYWVNDIENNGFSLADVARAFALQSESQALYPELGTTGTMDLEPNVAFVTAIFQNLFGRDPNNITDNGGADNFWVNELQNGADVGQLILDIISGAQGNDLAIISNKIDVGLAYSDASEAAGVLTRTAGADTILDDVDASAASVLAAKADIADTFPVVTPENPGEEYFLTSGTDAGADFTGTDADDTFNAFIAQNPFAGGVSNTLSSADRLDGGAGNDVIDGGDGADTITDEEGNSFYLIQVRTDKNHLGSDAHPLLIIPGMIATVDIITGEKSVLDYLLKPVLKARSEALRER